MHELLPVICGIAGDVFVFQQDNAPAHRSGDTLEVLWRQSTVYCCILGHAQQRININPGCGRLASAIC